MMIYLQYYYYKQLVGNMIVSNIVIFPFLLRATSVRFGIAIGRHWRGCRLFLPQEATDKIACLDTQIANIPREMEAVLVAIVCVPTNVLT